jgi:hypothetical protein
VTALDQSRSEAHLVTLEFGGQLQAALQGLERVDDIEAGEELELLHQRGHHAAVEAAVVLHPAVDPQPDLELRAVDVDVGRTACQRVPEQADRGARLLGLVVGGRLTRPRGRMRPH